MLFVFESVQAADRISLYRGVHSAHVSRTKKAEQGTRKRPTNNKNEVIGVSYGPISAYTYKNSHTSSIRNYSITYEWDYVGSGLVYGYDKDALLGDTVMIDDYKSELLPAAYLIAPWYTYSNTDFSIQIKSIISLGVINTGFKVSF